MKMGMCQWEWALLPCFTHIVNQERWITMKLGCNRRLAYNQNKLTSQCGMSENNNIQWCSLLTDGHTVGLGGNIELEHFRVVYSFIEFTCVRAHSLGVIVCALRETCHPGTHMAFEDQCRRSATKHIAKKGVNLTTFLALSYPMTNFTQFKLLSHIAVRTVMTALLIHFISVLKQLTTSFSIVIASFLDRLLSILDEFSMSFHYTYAT